VTTAILPGRTAPVPGSSHEKPGTSWSTPRFSGSRRWRLHSRCPGLDRRRLMFACCMGDLIEQYVAHRIAGGSKSHHRSADSLFLTFAPDQPAPRNPVPADNKPSLFPGKCSPRNNTRQRMPGTTSNNLCANPASPLESSHTNARNRRIGADPIILERHQMPSPIRMPSAPIPNVPSISRPGGTSRLQLHVRE